MLVLESPRGTDIDMCPRNKRNNYALYHYKKSNSTSVDLIKMLLKLTNYMYLSKGITSEYLNTLYSFRDRIRIKIRVRVRGRD